LFNVFTILLNNSFEMKKFFIVGGSSGIGKELVGLLADKGHTVFATYHKNDIQSDRNNVTYHHLDVIADSLDLDFLPDQLDGFAYCPGSINLMPFHRIKPDAFVDDYKLQVGGAIKILQQIQNRLKKSESPSVVLFSTVAVQNGFNFHSQVASSKGALEGLTRALAAEWAPTIRVNAIAPSITETPLAGRFLNTEDKVKTNADRHPLKRIDTPRHIADSALFLLSEKSSWITGQVMTIDGGISSIKL
jgi:NAD(P)-dependent dehydrogenase (short-subunit alcohol dehydrogenase family)